MSQNRTCLDLFAGLGGFSAAFSESDEWEVVTVDIDEQFNPDIEADVMELKPSRLPNPDVILASPPCTEFSPAKNLNGGYEPNGDHVTLVYHTLGIIKGLSPDYWFLENPRGRLRSYIGQPTATVTYCQYGEDTMKPTDLWGQHPPMDYRRCSAGDSCHINTRNGTTQMQKTKPTAKERAKVPYELSEQIYQSVINAAEQSQLPI